MSTIKSQMNSIFRKAGFSSRQQLISFLVEELLAGVSPAAETVELPAEIVAIEHSAGGQVSST